MLAALKHSWTEGAFAEPVTSLCSLDACHVPAWKLQGQLFLPSEPLVQEGLGTPSAPSCCPSLTFDTFPLFASAAESRVLHGGAVCEAPAEDPGPCSHHHVSEAQTIPTLAVSFSGRNGS